jgi:hypothetical protein
VRQPDAGSICAPADAFIAALTAVRRRTRLKDVLNAVAAGAGAAAVLALGMIAGGSSRSLASTSAAAALVSASIAIRQRRRWTPREAARLLERASAERTNVIVTAEELLRRPEAARGPIRRRVLVDAVSALDRVDRARAVPLRGHAAICLVALVLWAGALALPSGRGTAAGEGAGSPTGSEAAGTASGALRVAATIAPPAYLALSPQHLENPARMEAVAGSRLSLNVSGRADEWRVRLGARQLETTRGPDGVIAVADLSETTYLAIEHAAAPSQAGSRMLIPVIVTPDRTPSIVVEQPGKDLLFPDSSASVPVAAAATDDFGLRALELRYTRVSGSGEQFDFEEGRVPLEIERTSDRAWKGRAMLALARMKLQPGDALVYRIVGADARPGAAGAASSDAFFVEIAGPGEVSLAGFELPPDRERYALSQQMIVLKIQRLLARERSMTREALSEATGAIAAEQRSVRANFIFLTGGHVEDEEEEAEHSHEIQEGRLEHGARKEIAAAIQHMSRVEQALAAVDAGRALPPARAAVEALQRAFGRSRYFLRTLPVRSRLDPSRRLTGELDGAAGSRRDQPPPVPTRPGVRAARDIMQELFDLKPVLRGDSSGASAWRLSALAERALAVDPGSKEWRQIFADLIVLRDSVAENSGAGIDARLQQVFDRLRAEAQRQSVSPMAVEKGNPSLRGAWAKQRNWQ